MKLLRDIAGLACALTLLLLTFGFVGNFDYADALVTDAIRKDTRPQRARAYYRELLCDCLKQHKGKNLRLHIAHQPDMQMCRAACIYEGGAITEGTL